MTYNRDISITVTNGHKLNESDLHLFTKPDVTVTAHFLSNTYASDICRVGEGINYVTVVQPAQVVQMCRQAFVTVHWDCLAPPAYHQRAPATCQSP